MKEVADTPIINRTRRRAGESATISPRYKRRKNVQAEKRDKQNRKLRVTFKKVNIESILKDKGEDMLTKGERTQM